MIATLTLFSMVQTAHFPANNVQELWITVPVVTQILEHTTILMQLIINVFPSALHIIMSVTLNAKYALFNVKTAPEVPLIVLVVVTLVIFPSLIKPSLLELVWPVVLLVCMLIILLHKVHAWFVAPHVLHVQVGL